MTSLEQRIEDAFRKEGIHELIVRVGRYSGADLRAISTVQAIAIHRDARGGPWLGSPPRHAGVAERQTR